jgi:hypothetical protein
MLEIRKTSIVLDEPEIMQLERLITDDDGAEALRFLRQVVYRKVNRSQQGRLKSHLDTGGDPVDKFRMGQ